MVRGHGENTGRLYLLQGREPQSADRPIVKRLKAKPQCATGHGTGCPQCEQRLALIGIVLRHSGHSLVVGAGGGGADSNLRFRVFMPLITAKMHAATMTKSRTVLMN